MAYLATYTKQPADKLDYDCDCSDVVGTTDSVHTAVATVTPSGLTVSAVIVDDSTVKLWVESGTTGTTYKVELTVTTTLGRIKQGELRFKVKDF